MNIIIRFIAVAMSMFLFSGCAFQSNDSVNSAIADNAQTAESVSLLSEDTGDIVSNWPKNEATIYVSSDFHWQEESAKFRVEYLDEILQTLFDTTATDAPNALILCGDNTNDGKLIEHQAVANLLKDAEKMGVEIFVTMGNHDMYGEVTSRDIKEIYADFGFSEAISSDTDSMSYLAKLDDEIWLMSLDCNLYGSKTSETAATISDVSLDWVESCLALAQNEKAFVIPFSHHNVVNNAMGDLFVHYNIDRSEELIDLLLEYDAPIYLSGHRHSSFIADAIRGENILHEIVVDMPGNFPYQFTSLTFNANGTINYDIKKLDIEAWANENGYIGEEYEGFYSKREVEYKENLEEMASSLAVTLTDNTYAQNELVRYYMDIFTHSKYKTLGENAERLLNDPALKEWRKYEEETIFSRWMPWVLEYSTGQKNNMVLGPFYV